MRIDIYTKVHSHGFTVTVGDKQHDVEYPSYVWSSLPQSLRLPFAEFVAFITTVHLSFNNSDNIAYHSPPPVAESLFSYGLFLSMPENLTDYDHSDLKSSDYFRIVNNSFYRVSFEGLPRPVIHNPPGFKSKKNTALVPFSFGKDSLLTYALCEKLAVTPIPVYMVEPSNTYENNHKNKLIKQFFQEFAKKIVTFKVPMADLKEEKGLLWGWDIFLTQYTIFLIPFMYYYHAEYFFWSNEFESNEAAIDNEGFRVCQTFDQSGRWLQILNSCLRMFGCDTQLGSLLEPVTRLSILSLLHNHFPKLAKYQSSCINEHPSSGDKRWCGNCYECAAVYLYMVALGIDPCVVGLNDNMFGTQKYHLFSLFKKGPEVWQDKFTSRKYETLLALYSVYKKGRKGKLIGEFRKHYGAYMSNNFRKLTKQYFSLKPSYTIPQNIEPKLYDYYQSLLPPLRRRLI